MLCNIKAKKRSQKLGVRDCLKAQIHPLLTKSLSTPYQLRTKSKCIDTEQIQTRYGSNPIRIWVGTYLIFSFYPNMSCCWYILHRQSYEFSDWLPNLLLFAGILLLHC